MRKKKKRKKRVFKKFILLLICIIIGCNLINHILREDILSKINEKKGNISSYYVYGNHFNVSGSIELKNIDDSKISLVLKSNRVEEVLDAKLKINDNIITFNISEYINKGFNLNKLKKGKYYLLLKVENKEKIYYYSFKSKDEDILEFYTVSKNSNNKKITIRYDKTDEVMSFDVRKTTSRDTFYDITIDAGHGGIDTGSSFKLNGVTYYESDLTLKVSKSLKTKLEKMGYKVLLTRTDDTTLDYYGDLGRATIPNKNHTKLTLSIHLNSEEDVMDYGGVEVYTPNDIDYNFAKNLASNIVKYTNTKYSKKKSDRVMDGVYYSYFDDDDISEAFNDALANDTKPYDILNGAPEMYMIREVGGVVTKAYVDGRNEETGINPYYNSLISSESYLIELGYISYIKDLKNIVNNYDDYAKAISLAVDSYFK